MFYEESGNLSKYYEQIEKGTNMIQIQIVSKIAN